MQARNPKSDQTLVAAGFADGGSTPDFDPFAAARGLLTPVWIFDIDHGHVIHANAEACKMWGAEDEEELRARDMSSDMSSTVAKRLKQYQADFIRRRASFREMWTLYPNGVPVSSTVEFRGFRLLDGRMGMQCEVLADVGKEPENLRSAEALLHTDVMIALYALDGPALYMNPAARNMLGDPSDGLSTLFADSADYHVTMFELDRIGEHRIVTQVKTASDTHWFDLSAKHCSDAVTGQPAVLLTAIDVSELKNARDQARYLADRDQLTGCFNRAFLQRHLEELARYDRSRWSLLYFDVDRFKQVNDTFGHETGDVVLQELASRAQEAIGPGNYAARLGGDEFVLLMQEEAGQDHATRKVNDVFSKLSGPVRNGPTSVQVSVSMGVADFEPGKTDFETVLRQADIALYHSKREGRKRCTFYDGEMGEAAHSRAVLESEIQDALERREFVLHYQPKVDLQTGNVVAMEGLVRWNHPKQGIVAPREFIPICEETGLIETLGQQVLEIGFAQAMQWHKAGQDIQLSLNISPRQFTDERLMQTLKSYSQTAGFSAEKVELEITETVLIGDLEGITSKLKAITELGYRIAIDDFGTGYSNLSYISRIPLSCLKIDQSFINQLPKSGPIVKLILALGRQIGATIVAEGVETREQYDWLKKHRCDQIQGFFIARPAPIRELRKTMEQQRENF